MPINRAVFPSYSKVQHDDALMRWGFLSVVGFVALVAFPAGLGVAAIAPVLVPLLLGNQWLDAIPLIQILAIGGSISALQANVESVYFAKGLTRSRAKITALQVMLMLPLAFWLTRAYGVKGAATAYLITSLIVCVVNLTRVCRLININLTEILSCFLRPALSAFIMILSIHYLTPGSPSVEGTRGLAILLFWQLAVGIVVFTTVDFLIWRGAGSPKGPESFVLSFLKKSLIKPQK
jgi:O-antigen/teichoic acid export membrane protein